MKKSLLACAVGAAVVASPAFCREREFTGPSVTAIVGIDHNKQGDDHTGALYGGQIGYDFQSGGVVFGAEAELTGSTSDGCKTRQVAAPANTIRLCSKALRDLYVGGRIGAAVGGSTLLYGKVGYTNARVRAEGTYSATPASNFSGSGTSDGVRFGAGVETRLSGNLSVKAEYRYSEYDSLYSRHQGVIGLGLRF